MQVIRGKLERRQAIVAIGVQRFVPQLASVVPEQAYVPIPIAQYRALIDTGAQRTCLSQRAIATERLIRHGNRHIQNVHSSALHSLFFVNLGFFTNGYLDSLTETHGYHALPEPVEIINIADNHNFDAIVGMDVLRLFDMHFERSGHFEMRLG